MSIQRTESIESIPEADFIALMTEDIRMDELNAKQPSEFKLKESSGALLPEPLLLEDKTRFVLFPIKNNDVSIHLLSNTLISTSFT